jgi:hypothetical protein
MGNALKALWAAGFVANGTGIIEVGNDPFVKSGTFVKVHWPDSSRRLKGVGDDYLPWTDDHEPQPMVIARYKLVEVVEGELPRKETSAFAEKIIVAKISREVF